ncbi:hypothetical protein Kfla_3387 [Kribbella flavida DSM 17836]|uniref:SseB protein N-terminal domain-containing protein n=1 Tax=Kribbella flavida (strain DSM 17836 / JCM 10339 / NBRC 14399) TaxID=479435 RepID=D2PKY0_KRIFD|nr:hypothetical protein [Kribbella flavida]ADB32447.1 hypothetical protein Kfla_3387 [Kribbella flavida DSM 17836]
MEEATVTDVLAEAVRTDPSTANQEKLWAATFALERWWFVQRGGPENPQPFVGVHSDKPFLMAFTSAQRAREFAVANGLAGADDEVGVLALTPAGVVAQAPVWLQQGIAAITFDHGTSGFFAPLGNLPAIRSHVLGPA